MQLDFQDIAIKILIPTAIATGTTIMGIIIQGDIQEVRLNEHEDRLDRQRSFLEKYIVEFEILKEKVREAHE